MTNNRVVRHRMKQLRKMRGSQDAVGHATGVTGTYIRHIENGYVVPGLKFMRRLSDYFETPLEELFPDVFQENRN